MLDHRRKLADKLCTKLLVDLIFAGVHVLPFCEELFGQLGNLTLIDLRVDDFDRALGCFA